MTIIYLTVVVAGLPARPHVYLLCVVVVGQLVQVVVDRLEHQVSRDLFRAAKCTCIIMTSRSFLFIPFRWFIMPLYGSFDWWTC